MNIGIYKPGQGYWVRSMTAVFVGVIALFGAVWAWGQMEIIQLPSKAWQYTINYGGDPLPEGTEVEIHAPSIAADGSTVHIADGRVQGFDRRGSNIATISVGDILMRATEPIPPAASEAADTAPVESAAGEPAPTGESDDTTDANEPANTDNRQLDFTYTVAEASDLRIEGVQNDRLVDIRAIARVEIIPKAYLQAGAAALVILVSALLLLIYVGSNRKSVNFLIETDGEMKKVNWSSKREVIGSTQVVIVAAFLIAAILFGIDLTFRWFFSTVGVLET